MNDPAPPPAPLRFRDIAPALEYCAWTILLLTPLLRLANGPPVTPDQRSFQMIVVVGSFLAAMGLRVYNWRTSRGERTPEIEPGVPDDLARTTSRQRLEAAIRDDPDDASNYIALARRLLEEDRLEEAERTLEVAANYCSQQEPVQRELRVVQERRSERTRQLARAETGERGRAGGAEAWRRFPWIEALLGVAAAAIFSWTFPGAWGLVASYFGGMVWATAFLANLALLALLIWIRLR